MRISWTYKAGSWSHSMSLKTAFHAVCISFCLNGLRFQDWCYSIPTFIDNAFMGKERGEKRKKSSCILLKSYLYSLLSFNCLDRCQKKFLPVRICMYKSVGLFWKEWKSTSPYYFCCLILKHYGLLPVKVMEEQQPLDDD